MRLHLETVFLRRYLRLNEVITGEPWSDRIYVLMKDTRECSQGREATWGQGGRLSSTSQEEGPYQKPRRLTSWSWTSGLRNHEKWTCLRHPVYGILLRQSKQTTTWKVEMRWPLRALKPFGSPCFFLFNTVQWGAAPVKIFPILQKSTFLARLCCYLLYIILSHGKSKTGATPHRVVVRIQLIYGKCLE